METPYLWCGWAVLLTVTCLQLTQAAFTVTLPNTGFAISSFPGDDVGACKRGSGCGYFTGGLVRFPGTERFSLGENFAASVWLARTGNVGSYSGVFNNGYADATFELRYGREDSGSRFFANTRNNASVLQAFTFCSSIANQCSSVSKWAHYVFTQSNRVATIYANGVVVWTGAANGPIGTVANQYILGGNTQNEYFSGYMDDFRLYTRALDASEVISLYNGTGLNPAQLKRNLTMHVDFETGTQSLLVSDAPAAFTTPIASAITSNYVTITATHESAYIAVTSYRVRVCDSGNNCADSNFAALPANVTGFTAGGTFNITVAGVNVLGVGDWSPPLTVVVVDCLGNGVYPVTGGKCVCDSGYMGTACETAPSPSCVGTTPDLMSATVHPTIDALNTTFSGNKLVVTLVGGYIRKLSYRSLSIEGATNANCFLGAPNSYWTKVFNNGSCSDILQLQMPWATRATCGFVNSSRDDTTVTYTGKVVLVYEEKLGNFSGLPVLRTNQYTYDINVIFPLTLTVSISQISVVANVTMDVALSGQKYDSVAKILTLEFTSVIPFPSMLSLNSLDFAAPPTVSITQSAVTNSTCTTTGGSVCVQKVTAKLTLLDTATCNFDGQYTFVAKVQNCRGNSDGCDTKNTTVLFTMRSGSVCAEVSLTPQATVTMTASGALDMPPPTSYDVGAQAFFVVDVQAGRGNTYTLKFVNITYATTSNPQPSYLMRESAVTPSGTTAGLAVVTSTRNYFSLYLAGMLFGNVGSDSSITFTANCVITFTGNQKRTLDLSWDQKVVDTATNIRIRIPHTITSNNKNGNKHHNTHNDGVKIHNNAAVSTTTQVAHFVMWNVLGVGFFVFVVMAVAAFYKKSQQQNNNNNNDNYEVVLLDA